MRYKSVYLVIGVISLLATGTLGKLVLKTRPTTPRIYYRAPPGVSTLTVTAIEDVTGEQINVFRFSSSEDAEYFKIDSKGVMRTNKTIDKYIGTSFNFFIFGTLRGSVISEELKIIVSEKNEYPPVFTKPFYNASVYRYLDDRAILRVTANDADKQDYNRELKYFIPDYPASDFFTMTDIGDISLIKAPPPEMTYVTFNVFAINEVSPVRTSTTKVTVHFLDYNQPDVFCFVTGGDFIKLCWKNPMVGRNISGFVVKVTGKINDITILPGNPNSPEFCFIQPGTEVGQNYRFQINIQGTPDNEIELVLNKTGVGFTSECLNSHFSPCSYLNPCQHEGTCQNGEGQGLSYHCKCTSGWKGSNCSERDLCASNPCRNNGACLFLGHQLYTCECGKNYLGSDCQHFNTCSVSPCKNGGICHMNRYGGFTCDCPDQFSGENCEVPDPCRPSPCGRRGFCTGLGDSDYKCTCMTGYQGNNCDDIDRCVLEAPCKNKGTCVPTGNNTFVCECTPVTTGQYCEHFDPCSQYPCFNNATCHATGFAKYKCDCSPGYHGGECQYFDPCRQTNCNNGECVLDNENTRCICDDGYFGDKCQFLDPCISLPCVNGGTCRNVTSTEYVCECLQEWFGPNCENLKSCTLNLCENNSTCVNRPPSSYECICQPGFYGEQCSIYNQCYSLPCQNNGECVNTTDGYYCNCKPGYGGKDCEFNDLCRANPCATNGKCVTVSDKSFVCECDEGFKGARCNDRDPCFPNLCSNGGKCVAAANDFTCICKDDHYGKLCHYLNYCKSKPCNNGTCHLRYDQDSVDDTGDRKVDFQQGFSCQCGDGYTGLHCELRLMGCVGWCLNGGVCDGTVCQCGKYYKGDRCEVAVSPCDPNPCRINQLCMSKDQSYTCQCLNGATTSDCFTGCRSEVTEGPSGRYIWPNTDLDETAEVICPYGAIPGGDGIATRDCFKMKGKAVWDKPNTSQCSKTDLGAVNQQLDSLKSLTSDPSKLGPEDVTKVTDILETVAGYSLEHKNIAESMVTVVSNLAEVNRSVMVTSSQKSNTSGRLLTILEDYTAGAKLEDDDDAISLSTNNIDVKAMDIYPDKIRNITIRYEPQVNPNQTDQRGVFISLPPEIFQDDNTGAKYIRVQFMGFQKSTFFTPDKPTDFEMDNVSGQRVVTAIVKGRKLHNLTSLISFKMPSIEKNSNHTCVYWDTKEKRWSSEGVVTGISDDMTECWSNHLTSFAILLDPSPSYVLPVIHEDILTFITYIGCAISMVGLILTIITYSLFKCLHGEKSGKILLNLCVAMLLMNVAFLLGSQSSSQYGEDICIVVAALLHLFLLATLMWMLVEAVEMYQALVTVFHKYAGFYMVKRCIAGWGIPILIVSITLAVDLAHYIPTRDFCFLSQSSPIAYYLTLVGPACLILLINTIVFIMVARVILKPRFQQQEQPRVTPAQVRGAFTVMILLGITWVFGPLAINEAKLVFNYLFCILNSLQGFMLFVFRCLFNPEARLAWKQLITTGTFKRRRGPVKSVYSSEVSSKMEKSNGHSNGHSKSNIIQANGWQGNRLNNSYSSGDESPRNYNKNINLDNNILSAKDSTNTEVEYLPNVNVDDSTRL